MQYTEQELSQLIKNLEVEFSSHIADVTAAAQPTSLAKAEDEKPSEDKKPEGKEESKPESKEEAEKPEAPAAEGKEAPAKEEAAPEAAAPAAEAPVAPSADEGASGYDAEDIAHMDQMYMSMSKAELIAHHDSCVRALDAQGAEHSHAQAPNAAAPAAPAAPAAEIDKCGDMSMSKSEETGKVEVPTETKPNVELELAKSEAGAFKAKAEDLQKNLDAVQAFLTKLVKTVPQGKAITSLEQVAPIAKNEGNEDVKEITKAEVDSKLLAKSADPKLAKSDREAINAYYLNKANFNTISHLLK